MDLYLESLTATYHAMIDEEVVFLCLVPRCLGQLGMEWNLCNHFSMLHPLDVFQTSDYILFPPCKPYGMQMNPELPDHQHKGTAF